MMPVVMAGVLAIYGLLVSVMISGNLKEELSLYKAFIQLGAGLSTGLTGLAAGFVLPPPRSFVLLSSRCSSLCLCHSSPRQGN